MFNVPEGYPDSAAEAFALLQTRPKLSIDDMKILALIEQGAEGFYLDLAKAAGNPEVARLLERNGHEERGHAHRLVKALRLLGETFSLPPVEQNPYHRPTHFAALDPGFLDMLKQGERDADAGYNVWADHAPNAEVAKILRQNGKEESGHGERVAAALALLAGAQSGTH